MTGRIAYICNDDIYGMNLDTGEVTRRSHGAKYLRLDGSPDGEKILYENLSSGRLEFFVVNADGTGRQRLASVRSSAEDWNRIHNLLWLS